ncbi:ferredoxin Fer [Halobellus limi]|uniref:Ferredoxin n=1 Tax=Halobellus limi TaxID=699433 RepID=A0A1H5TGX1_9EURY|nr:ferredoxin Fer [Halobellus limi]QCC47326.1 ferredoxin [Halobellus limi]SEF61448.1 Ferredoxin [Halobellus limi]
MESPYDVLGIDADADEDAVVRAYRKRVKDAHPDHGGSLAEFERVRRAYEHVTEGRDPSTFEADVDDDRGRRNGTTGGGDSVSRRQTDEGRGSTRSREESGSAEDSAGEDGERTLGPTVEYLDYEVLEANGWELTDEDLFEKAEAADLDVDRHGLLVVEDRETLLEAAERYGFSWPYACRGGACANCAVAVVEGDVEMPVSTVLTDEMKERGIRLSCIGQPVTDSLKVVFNIERLPGLAELRLPAEQFESARADD